jgi:hypothetical protein
LWDYDGQKEIAARVKEQRPWLEGSYNGLRTYRPSNIRDGTVSSGFRVNYTRDGHITHKVEIDDEVVDEGEVTVELISEAVETIIDLYEDAEPQLTDTPYFRTKVVESIIESRGKRSMVADASKTASIVVPAGGSKEEFLEWAKNSRRFDLEHTDTAEVGAVQARIRGLIALSEDNGFVKEFHNTDKETVNREYLKQPSKWGFRGASGFFDGMGSKVYVRNRSDHGRNLDEFPYASAYENLVAHEFGHAVSYGELGWAGSGYYSSIASEIIHDFDMYTGTREEVVEEFKTVSNRVRGDIDSARNKKYRMDEEELFADWVAAAVLDPEWTFEQSPNILATLRREIAENPEDEAFAVLEPIVDNELADYSSIRSKLVKRYDNPWLGGWRRSR